LLEKTRARIARIPPEDRIYYTRLIFSVIAASICIRFNLSGPLGVVGFFTGVLLLCLAYLVAIYLLGVNPESVGGHAKGFLTGLGTSLLLFLVLWIIIYNFLVIF